MGSLTSEASPGKLEIGEVFIYSSIVNDPHHFCGQEFSSSQRRDSRYARSKNTRPSSEFATAE